jgi:hypothetical protein
MPSLVGSMTRTMEVHTGPAEKQDTISKIKEDMEMVLKP